MDILVTFGLSKMNLLLKKNVLVIKFLGIGDVLFTTPMLRGLKQLYPHLHVTYLTSSFCAPIINSNPNVDEIIAHEPPSKSIWQLFSLIRLLRQKRFDAVFICHRSVFAIAFAYCVGSPVRLGFNYKGLGFLLTNKIDVEKNIFAPSLYLKLLTTINYNDVDIYSDTRLQLFCSDEDRYFADNILIGINSNFTIAIAPGGGVNAWMDMSRKRWPVEGFIQLIRCIPTQFKIILLGGKSDIEISDEIEGQLPDRVINLTGKTTLIQAAEIIHRTRVFVGIDSALLHVASAVGVPTVSLFGPTNPEYFAPRGTSHHTIIAKSDLPCRPCFSYKHLPECNNYRCMNLIEANQVFEIVARYI
jgi:lipopolysaccharide heptosyltransferase II